MENETFDYIVVGAGSAGSVLANRLSADLKHRVLVLEAGQESHPWSRIPVGFARFDPEPGSELAVFFGARPRHWTTPYPGAARQAAGWPSSVNGMVFVRGQSQDYDTWAQLDNRGWSYREVLPIFKDMESYLGDGDDEYRGRNGPLKVSENNERGPIYDALIKAAGEIESSPLGKGHLGIGIDDTLLVDPPDPLEGVDIERVLRRAVPSRRWWNWVVA